MSDHIRVVNLAEGRIELAEPRTKYRAPEFETDRSGRVRLWLINEKRWIKCHPIDARDHLSKGFANRTGGDEPESAPGSPSAEFDEWPLESTEEAYIERYQGQEGLSELVAQRLALARARVEAGMSAGASEG